MNQNRQGDEMIRKHGQSDMAIQNAELATKDAGKLRRLEKLAQASGEIMGNLGGMSLDQRLSLIAKHAAEILEAEACGICLVKRPGFLSIEASYGHREKVVDKGIELAIRSGPLSGLTGHIAYEGKLFNAHGDALKKHFAVKGGPAYAASGQCYSLLAIPLRKKEGREEELIGLLRVDNKKDENGRIGPTVGFSQEDEWILQLFADAAIVAIEGAELVDRLREQAAHLVELVELTDRHKQLLAALDQASRHIRAERETSKLLPEIVRLAVELTSCVGGGIYINHPHLEELELQAFYGLPAELIASRLRHTQGVVGLVARTGQTQVVHEYAIWPNREVLLASSSFETMVGVPLKRAGEVEAVLFVVDDTRSRQFTETDQEVLERFAEQAIIALQSSRLMSQEQRMFGQLTILHKISDYIQEAGDLDKILHVVLTGVTAEYGLTFDRAVLLLLDESHEKLVGHMGIGELVEPRTPEVRLTGDDRELYDFGRYLNMLDQDSLPLTPIGERIRGLQLPVGTAVSDIFIQVIRERRCTLVAERQTLDKLPDAFLEAFAPALPLIVVPLVAREQAIGLLVADNKFTKSPITLEDTELLLTFANTAAVAIENAAFALKQAKLLEQVSRARNTAKVVAEVTTLEDIDNTLRSVAEGTKDALDCDAVTLYSYDQQKDRLNYPPTMAGVRYPERASRRSDFSPNYIVFQILQRDQPYIAEDVASDSLFTGRRFALDEQISSCVAIPLRVGPEKVGVMFVNYRVPHRFTPDEMANIELFANQAAVAMRNVQLYERVQRRAGALQAIYEAGQAVTSSLDLDKILTAIAEQAWRLASIYSDEKARFSHLALVDGDKLRFVAAYPVEHLASLNKNIGDIDLKTDKSIGVTGQAVIAGQSLLVGDVSQNENYLEADPETHSELAVLIKAGDRVIGVINVEHSEFNAFDENDRHALESLAAQAAIAIQNANLFQEHEQRARQMEAIAEISRTVNTSLDLYVALTTILTSIKSLIDYVAAEICLWHADRQTMVVMGQAGDSRYTEQAKGFYTLDEGYAGWIARHWKPLLVEDSFAREDVRPKVIDPKRPIRSFLGVPLRAGNDRFGTIELVSDTPYAFDEEAEKLLGVIGQHAIVAIKNARLFEAEQRRAEYLTAIQQVSEATSSTLDSSEIFRGALAEMLEVFKLDQGVVILFDQAGGYGYTLIEDTKRSLVKDQNLSISLEDTAAIDWILSYKHSFVVEDVAQDAQLHGIREFVPDSVRSMLLVPVIIKDNVIGAINLYAYTKRKFTGREVELAQTMTNQVAAAIENAQLYEQAEKRVRMLNTLYEAGQAITSSLELDEILNLIAEQAWQLTIYQGKKISFASISLVEETGLKVVAAYPPELLLKFKAILEQEFDVRVGNTPIGIIGRTINAGEPQLVGDVTRDADYLETYPGTRSELVVPIKIGDEIIGVINVEHSDLNAFDEDDQQALESLAAQAAIAIQNARLFNETQRHARLLDAATRVARGATSILDEDELIDEAVSLIVNYFDFFYHAAVFLLDNSREYAILRAASSEGGQRMLARGHKLKVGQEGIVGFVTHYGEPRLTSDVTQDPHHYVNRDLPDTRAEMAFPLITRGQVIGALDVQSTEVVNLTGEDIATLQTMADQLANAIQNARLFEAEQRRTEHLATIHRVSEAASSTLNMETVLFRTVSEMVWAFLGIDQGDAVLFSQQDNRGHIIAEYPRSGQANHALSLADETAMKWVLTHREPLAIADVSVDPRLGDMRWLLDRWGVQSMLLTPLLAGDEVLGTINLYSIHESRQSTGEEMELAQTMANQIAVVIKNLQSQEEVSAIQTVNSAFMLLSRWAHKVRQKNFALRKDLESLKKDLPIGLFDNILDRMSESLEELSLPTQVLTGGGAEESSEQSVELAQLLEDVAARLCRNRKVPIEFVLKSNEVRCSAIGNQLFFEIAIEMLVENAVASIEQKGEPGTLEIQSFIRNDIVTTQIRDTGCGIPPEIEKELFRRRVASKKGFGYGSFTAANILRAYKGDVRVVETSSDGTLIEFSLPVAQK